MPVASTKSARRPRELPKAEPLYLWLPVSLLVVSDLVVTNQQELRVKTITYKEEGDEWLVALIHPETRQRAEESYRRHQFLYVKATEDVKKRLKNQEKAK